MIARWPLELPQRVLANGYSEGLADGRLRTAMETGIPKSRRRFSAATKPVAASFVVSLDQKARIQRFWEEEIAGGALPFLIPDQTKDGQPLLVEPGVPLLDDEGRPLLISAWWLVMAGETAPTFTARSREITFTAAFPLMVMP